jgi:hypothetical protein
MVHTGPAFSILTAIAASSSIYTLLNYLTMFKLSVKCAI